MPVRDINMTAKFDFKKVWDSEELSDVTIKFADREIKCHKVLLSNKSEYFKVMFESKFKEAGEKVVELKEDEDPDAVAAMLQYIYTFSYNKQAPAARSVDPSFHLHVWATARKYIVPELEKTALGNLKAVCTAISDVDVILAFIEGHGKHYGQDGTTGAIVKKLTEKHASALITKPRFRAVCGTDDILWELLVKKVTAMDELQVSKTIKCGFCGQLGDDISTHMSCYNCGDVVKEDATTLINGARLIRSWTEK